MMFENSIVCQYLFLLWSAVGGLVLVPSSHMGGGVGVCRMAPFGFEGVIEIELIIFFTGYILRINQHGFYCLSVGHVPALLLPRRV